MRFHEVRSVQSAKNAKSATIIVSILRTSQIIKRMILIDKYILRIFYISLNFRTKNFFWQEYALQPL